MKTFATYFAFVAVIAATSNAIRLGAQPFEIEQANENLAQTEPEGYNLAQTEASVERRCFFCWIG